MVAVHHCHNSWWRSRVQIQTADFEVANAKDLVLSIGDISPNNFKRRAN